MSRNRNRLICFFFAFVIFVNLTVSEDQQFSNLAESFLQGKTYFLSTPGFGHDTALFQGRYYWPLGPFPAVLLSPFVLLFRLLNRFFSQSYLQIVLVFAVFYGLFRIARKLGYSSDDAWYLALAFCFSSAFLGVAAYSGSWYFAQVVTVFLLVAALFEFVGRKRYWIIGVLMALTCATRLSAGLNILFFLMVVALEKSAWRHKFKSVCALTIPVILVAVALGIYNEARFGDWLEQGYSLQILEGAAARARSYGVMSLIHVPGNLFYFLVAGPVPVLLDNVSQVLKFPYLRANPWGMSLFITSPYFLYLFLVKYNDFQSKLLIISIAVVAGSIFAYYGIGRVQFGYRYSLDFLPFLFFLLIKNYQMERQRLSECFKNIILVTAVTNTYFVLTVLHFDWSPLH